MSIHHSSVSTHVSSIDHLKTADDLHEWISQTDFSLERQRDFLIELKRALDTKRISWEKWYRLHSYHKSLFHQRLVLWRQAHQMLPLVEQRTWADLEGEDGPDPNEAEIQSGEKVTQEDVQIKVETIQ